MHAHINARFFALLFQILLLSCAVAGDTSAKHTQNLIAFELRASKTRKHACKSNCVKAKHVSKQLLACKHARKQVQATRITHACRKAIQKNCNVSCYVFSLACIFYTHMESIIDLLYLFCKKIQKNLLPRGIALLLNYMCILLLFGSEPTQVSRVPTTETL